MTPSPTHTQPSTVPMLDYLSRITTHVTGVPLAELRSPSRLRVCSDARRIFCHIANHNLHISLTDIAAYLQRHHATVINALKTYDILYDTDHRFRALADDALSLANLFLQ